MAFVFRTSIGPNTRKAVGGKSRVVPTTAVFELFISFNKQLIAPISSVSASYTHYRVVMML